MSASLPQRVVRSYRQRIEVPPAEVFPLICPVREAEWLDGWTYEMVYSASGLAEPGAVFTTELHGPKTVWVITRHDPAEGIVEFVRLTPGLVVAHLRVALSPNDDGTTAADVTYTFTALSETGAQAIAHQHSEEAFEAMVVTWEQSMNHFLRTGETLRGGAH